MATTKAVSFTCPHCAKVLRASARPPAGKKIKCPACAHAFVPELDEEVKATAIQEEPTSKSKKPARADDDEDLDEKPRNRKSRADEDEDDDVRSIKKKKTKKKSSDMFWTILLVVLGGGGLVSCIGCGVGGYFLWPMMFGGNDDLIAFVPPDSNVLVGARPKELKTKFSGFKDMFGQAAGANPGDPWPEMDDLMLNSEQFLMFMNTKNLAGKNMIAVIKAEPADIAKLKGSKRLEAAKTVGGHAIHRVKQRQAGGFGGGPDRLAFSGSRLVVITDLDDNQLVAALDRAKNPPAKSPAIELSRSVDRSPAWMAFTFDADARKGLREVMQKGGQQIPAMAAAAPAVDGAKGLTVTLDATPANDVKVTANVMCKNGDDATKVKAGLEEGWKTAKGMIDGFMMLAPPQPGPQAEAQKLMMRDLGTLAFKSQGDTASATLTFTNQTIQELAKAGNAMPFGGMAGGFNPPGPPKIGPPPIVPPKGGKMSRFSALNFTAGQTKEFPCSFQQATPLQIDIQAASPQGTTVEVTILQGAAGENVIFTDKQAAAVRTVNCNIPEGGQYRVRLKNNGPGRVNNCTVMLFEK